MRREIAAVHRRDVARSQWSQSLRVVPVVEMSLVALERGHRLKCFRGAFDQGAGRDVAEVRGREARELRNADVGRRGAVRDHGAGLLLEIVGRQPVVLLDDELLEVGPGLARDAAQENRLLTRQLRSAADQRPAEPPGEDGRRKPKHEDGQGGRQCARFPGRESGRGEAREEGSGPHRANRAEEIGRGLPIVIRAPFQQVPPGDQHPNGGAQDRCGAHGRLMRQAGDPEPGLREARARSNAWRPRGAG